MDENFEEQSQQSIKQLATKQTTPAQKEIQKPASKKFMKIIVIVIVVAILIVLAVFILKKEKNGDGGGNGGNRGAVSGDALTNCIKTEEYSAACGLLLTSPDIGEKCRALGNLKDKCFYKVGVANNDLNYCEKIADTNIKQKCSNEVFIINPRE